MSTDPDPLNTSLGRVQITAFSFWEVSKDEDEWVVINVALLQCKAWLFHRKINCNPKINYNHPNLGEDTKNFIRELI